MPGPPWGFSVVPILNAATTDLLTLTAKSMISGDACKLPDGLRPVVFGRGPAPCIVSSQIPLTEPACDLRQRLP